MAPNTATPAANPVTPNNRQSNVVRRTNPQMPSTQLEVVARTPTASNNAAPRTDSSVRPRNAHTIADPPRLPTANEDRASELSDDVQTLRRQMLEQQERHRREMHALKRDMEGLKEAAQRDENEVLHAFHEDKKLLAKLATKVDSLLADMQGLQAAHSALRSEVRQMGRSAGDVSFRVGSHNNPVNTSTTQRTYVGSSSSVAHETGRWGGGAPNVSAVAHQQDTRIDTLTSQLSSVQHDLQLLLKATFAHQNTSPEPVAQPARLARGTRYDTKEDEHNLLLFAKEEFTDVTARATPHQNRRQDTQQFTPRPTAYHTTGALTPLHPEAAGKSNAAGRRGDRHATSTPKHVSAKGAVYREDTIEHGDDTTRRVASAVHRSSHYTDPKANQSRHLLAPPPTYRSESGKSQTIPKLSPTRSSPPRPGEWRVDYHRSTSSL